MDKYPYERAIVTEILKGLGMKKKLLHIMSDPGRPVRPQRLYRSKRSGKVLSLMPLPIYLCLRNRNGSALIGSVRKARQDVPETEDRRCFSSSMRSKKSGDGVRLSKCFGIRRAEENHAFRYLFRGLQLCFQDF